MSGIAGILNLDGSPIDGSLLARMTEHLRFRGPDGQGMHASANVGLAHTLLRLDGDAARSTGEEQPFTTDGRRFIVADARIDARDDLAAALRGRGHLVRIDAPDAELILRAYAAWGDDCVAHLLGDFTFAIWDGPERRVFCARDQIGIKPFFYAQTSRAFIFSNTLDCVRLHPDVSSELDDLAIADFLLFGANQQFHTTSFRDVKRLAPAHSLSASSENVTARRYFTLPVDEPLRFRRAGEYTERFTGLLRSAVSDRLRSNAVGVLMSGGLDSPSIAATAASIMRERTGGARVHAITSVYDRLIPDDERHYAGLVARHLGIPIHYDVRDDETSIADWHHVAIRTPEPVDNPAAFSAGVQFLEKHSAHARVFLYGEGPDNALRYEWQPYLSHLIERRRLGELLGALSSDLLMHPRVPLWSLMREAAGARRQAERWRVSYPEWIDAGFAARCQCRDRWNASLLAAPPVHPIRPRGYASLGSPNWQSLFDECDVQGAMVGTETRHPFLDLRVLRYMLALPAMPWCRKKLIIRRAMASALPDAVINRKKSGVQGHPDLVRTQAAGLPTLAPSAILSRYVNAGKVPVVAATIPELRSVLRPLGLSYWLQDFTRLQTRGARL